MRQKRYGVAALMLALLWSSQAAAAKVELLRVGNDDAPTIGWCDKNNRMLTPGSVMDVTIMGHNVTGASSVSGTIRLKTVTDFQWANLRDPVVTFGPTGSTPSTFPISAKRSAPLTRHTIVFAAVDDVGAESPLDACKIQVAASLSLVEVGGLALDRTQVVANQQATVKLRVRNTTSGPLASVPWMIWTSQPAARSGRLGGGIVGSSPPRTAVLGSGVLQNVPAGASFEVAAPWAPSQIGTYDVVGQVDPKNTLGENQSERGNNRQQVTVSVATAGPPLYQIPPASPPQTPPAAAPRKCGTCEPLCFRCATNIDCMPGFYCCDNVCVKN